MSTSFKVDLYIDTQRIIGSVISGLGALTAGGADDFSTTWGISGWHTIRLVVDPDNTVVESNEANNTWTGQFYWEAAPTVWPTILAPTGIIYATDPTIAPRVRPDFIWNALPVSETSYYEFHLYSFAVGARYLQISIYLTRRLFAMEPPVPTSSIHICSPGDYQFRLKGNSLSYSPWQIFTVAGSPAVPAILSPSGTVSTGAPTFSWSKSVYASWYELYIYPLGSSTPVLSQTSIPALSTCFGSTCTWKSTGVLDRGDYQFQLPRRQSLGGQRFQPGELLCRLRYKKSFPACNTPLSQARLHWSLPAFAKSGSKVHSKFFCPLDLETIQKKREAHPHLGISLSFTFLYRLDRHRLRWAVPYSTAPLIVIPHTRL